MVLRNRIALTFTIITTISLCVIMAGMYLFFYQNSLLQYYDRLEERSKIAAQMQLEQDELNYKILNQIRQQYLRRLVDEREYLICLDDMTSSDDTPVPAFFDQELLRKINNEGYAEFQLGDFLGVGIKYIDNQGTYAVLITANDYYGKLKLVSLWEIMLVSLFFYLLIVFFIGRWYAIQSLRPITGMIHRMHEINSRKLYLRLEENPSNRDELTELAGTFNQMLDRIETSVEAQSNFIGNASHQLKNPLTAILGIAEHTLHMDRDPEQYRQALQAVEQEASRLRLLILQLIRMAHTESRTEDSEWQECRIDELLFEVAEEFNALSTQGKVFVNCTEFPVQSESLQLRIHKNLIRIALSNLIENARKFSSFQDVSVRLRVNARFVEAEVEDKGIGVPPDAIAGIFDPFFRADNARAFPGFGIGLPLARRIARLHGGDIYMRSQEGGGSVFILRLPLEPDTF